MSAVTLAGLLSKEADLLALLALWSDTVFPLHLNRDPGQMNLD